MNTGENLKLADYRTIDFNLGICDRDRFFKIPDVCKPVNEELKSLEW